MGQTGLENRKWMAKLHGKSSSTVKCMMEKDPRRWIQERSDSDRHTGTHLEAARVSCLTDRLLRSKD